MRDIRENSATPLLPSGSVAARQTEATRRWNREEEEVGRIKAGGIQPIARAARGIPRAMRLMTGDRLTREHVKCTSVSQRSSIVSLRSFLQNKDML